MMLTDKYSIIIHIYYVLHTDSTKYRLDSGVPMAKPSFPVEKISQNRDILYHFDRTSGLGSCVPPLSARYESQTLFSEMSLSNMAVTW